MTRTPVRFAPALLLAVAAAPLSGQIGALQLELDAGLVHPTGGYAGVGPGRGEAFPAPEPEYDRATFGVHFALTQGPLSWRVGFSQHRAGCAQGLCEGDLISTAWDVGVRLSLPFGSVIPWIGGGLTSQITEGDFFDPLLDPVPGAPIPTFAAESDRAWGLEGGAGLLIRLSERFGLDPAVRYNRTTPSIGAPANREIEIQQWIFDFGLVLGF